MSNEGWIASEKHDFWGESRNAFFQRLDGGSFTKLNTKSPSLDSQWRRNKKSRLDPPTLDVLFLTACAHVPFLFRRHTNAAVAAALSLP